MHRGDPGSPKAEAARELELFGKIADLMKRTRCRRLQMMMIGVPTTPDALVAGSSTWSLRDRTFVGRTGQLIGAIRSMRRRASAGRR